MYFNFENLACGCNKKGVENGDLTCDEQGRCRCRCDVQGDKCSECEPGHQGFPECHGKSTLKILTFSIQVHYVTFFSNIETPIIRSFACQCSLFGTKNCNAQGRCICADGYEGTKCDECQVGFAKNTTGACIGKIFFVPNSLSEQS